MDKKQLRQLLAQNRMERLFEGLQELAEKNNRDDLTEELTELKGRWEAYQENERGGTATFEQLKVEHNQIRKAFSQQIKKAFQPLTTNDKIKRRPFFWPILIATVCVLLTIIGYIPTKQASFQIDAQTEFIQVQLAEDWDIDFDFFMHEFETQQLEALALPDTAFETAEPNMKLLAKGGQIQLAGIVLPNEATISLLNEKDNGWQLDVKDQSVYGYLETTDATISIEQDDQAVYEKFYPADEDGSPEVIEFQTSQGARFFANVCEDCEFKISRLGISSVKFLWNPSKSEFESSIQEGGTLSVENTKTIALKEKDDIQLSGLSDTYLTLERSNTGFKVHLEGKAQTIQHGFKGKLKSQKPNLIQTLSHNANAKLFYTTLVWLLGIGFGIWTTFGKFRKKD